ncbi:MAG: NusG domain II-containing protein [Thermodesulfovibrionales bacterium]|nr:NusG domain II-containing protein [Thermodesulfovibrionales bacterium]
MNFREILKFTTVADRVLFSILILLSLLGLIFVRSLIPGGNSVEIDVDGNLEYVLPLDEEKTVSVQGPQGTTLIEIRNHRVRVVESPCQNRLCIQQGWVEHGVITCLPNKVLLTVGKNRKMGSEPDAVTE